MPKKSMITKLSGPKGRQRLASEGDKRAVMAHFGRAQGKDGESKLLIDGAFSDAEKKEIFALIEAAGHRATKKDPKATIDLIEEKRGAITVYVSTNHLALVLGKKLHSARKGGELTITWSHDDMPVFVHWRKK